MRSIGVAVAHPDPRLVDELVHDVEAAADLYLALDPASAGVIVCGESGLQAFSQEPPRPGVGMVGLSVDGDVTRVARAALACGAHEIVRWPDERHSLRSIVRDAAARASLRAAGTDGRVVAVVGARGGVGTSTVASLLAACLPDAAIVDLDRVGAGQSNFVARDVTPTLDEVLAAAGDLDPTAFASALVPHAAGRVLFGPPRAPSVSADQIVKVLTLLRASVPFAVCDAGRGGDEGGRVLLSNADVVVSVGAGDIGSVRGALALQSAASRPIRFVLNASERSRLRPRDVGRVLGTPVAAVVPFDPAVRRAGEAGRLPARGPARRSVARYARALEEELANGS